MQIIKLNLWEEISLIKNKMGIDESIKHIYQPTGNSCGPTCIKMVGDFLSGNIPSIDEICQMCGTDWVVGTPPDKMKKGLDMLGIKYIEHISEIEPFQSIKNTIDKDHFAIVRTVTKKVPHWILIHNYDGDTFMVNDPWLGEIKYNEKQLGKIWKIRDYFYFEIIAKEKKVEENVVIRKIEKEDLTQIINNLGDIFDKTGIPNQGIWNMIKHSNMDITIVATVNDELAGFYFFNDENIPPYPGIDYTEFANLKGVEGVALGVLKKFRNMDIGKKLIQYSQNNLGYDYIWGYQLKSLKNIDDWLKRRKIYLETPVMYITYQLLKK